MGGSESRQENGSDQSEEIEQQSSDSTALKAVCAAGAVAAAGAALLWGLSSVGAGQNDEEDHNKSSKLMNAPGGKGELIARQKFEDNPKAYFRDLHG